MNRRFKAFSVVLLFCVIFVCILLLTQCGISEGQVVDTVLEPYEERIEKVEEAVYKTEQYITIINGKTSLSTRSVYDYTDLVTYRIFDNEDYIITISAMNNKGKVVSSNFYLKKDFLNAFFYVGAMYKHKLKYGSRKDFNNKKEEIGRVYLRSTR